MLGCKGCWEKDVASAMKCTIFMFVHQLSCPFSDTRNEISPFLPATLMLFEWVSYLAKQKHSTTSNLYVSLLGRHAPALRESKPRTAKKVMWLSMTGLFWAALGPLLSFHFYPPNYALSPACVSWSFQRKKCSFWTRKPRNLCRHKWTNEVQCSHRACHSRQHTFNSFERKRRYYARHFPW